MKKTLLILLTFGVLQSYSQTTDGLVSYYSFNAGTVVDDHGTNDATNVGATPTTDMFTNDSSSYAFDGTNDHINLGADSSLKPIDGTVSLWAKMDGISVSGSGTAFNPLIMSKNTNAGSFFEAYSIYIRQSDAQIWAICTDPSNNGQKIINTVGNMKTNEWTHFTLSWDTDSMSLYINGVLEARRAKGFTSVYSSTEQVRLGRLLGGSNDRFFDGKIDEVRIYDRVLTDEEVLEVAATTNPSFTTITNGTASASGDTLCAEETTSVTISNTQSDVKYVVTNSGNVVAGPTAGNGGDLNLTTSALSTTATLKSYASYSGTADTDNGAFFFDGIDDYIEIPLDTTFRYDTAYTFEAWVKSPLPGSNFKYPVFFSIYTADSTDLEIYLQRINNDIIVAHNRTKNTGFGYEGFSTPPNNDWYHLAVSYDGTDRSVYYNGELQNVEQASAANNAPKRSENATMAFGIMNSVDWNVSETYYDGFMDNARVWNVARTQEQIQENIYNCLAGDEEGLKYLFKFDDGSGTTLKDHANGNDATLYNTEDFSWVQGTFSCGVQLNSVTVNVKDCDSTTNINEVIESEIAVFPNPTTDFINVNSMIPVQGLELRNIKGQMVRSSNHNQLDISTLDRGVYVLFIRTTEGVRSAKVVKQ